MSVNNFQLMMSTIKDYQSVNDRGGNLNKDAFFGHTNVLVGPGFSSADKYWREITKGKEWESEYPPYSVYQTLGFSHFLVSTALENSYDDMILKRDTYISSYLELNELLAKRDNLDDNEKIRLNTLSSQIFTMSADAINAQKVYLDYLSLASLYYNIDINFTDEDKKKIENINLTSKPTFGLAEIETINNLYNNLLINGYLTDLEYEKLKNILERTPLYWNIFLQEVAGQRFKYNIDRTLNLKLLDLRNYHNFRNSNLGTYEKDEKTSTITWKRNVANITTLDGTNSSKSFYMSKNDFYWSLNYNSISDIDVGGMLKQSIQNIILNEYQPKLQYGLGKEAVNLLGSSIEFLIGKMGSIGKVGANLVGLGANLATTKYINDTIDKYSETPDLLYNLELAKAEGYNINPMYFVQRLFTNGRWLNTYELPFVANGQVKTDYIKPSKDAGTWNIGGLTDGVKDNSTVQKVLRERIGLSIPTTPTFSLDNTQQATYGDFSIDFYLINKNDQYLDKNFQFMHAFFAGTQWLLLQVGTIIAPNVYHVIVPGRFQIHWASVESTFEAVGKLRTNMFMHTKYGQDKNSPNYVGSILGDTLWPEAWKVTINITPLTQWNFNTYIDYFVNGFHEKQRAWLATPKSNWSDTIITDLHRSAQDEAERTIYKNQTKSAMEEINRLKGDIFGDDSGTIIDANKLAAISLQAKIVRESQNQLIDKDKIEIRALLLQIEAAKEKGEPVSNIKALEKQLLNARIKLGKDEAITKELDQTLSFIPLDAHNSAYSEQKIGDLKRSNQTIIGNFTTREEEAVARNYSILQLTSTMRGSALLLESLNDATAMRKAKQLYNEQVGLGNVTPLQENFANLSDENKLEMMKKYRDQINMIMDNGAQTYNEKAESVNMVYTAFNEVKKASGLDIQIVQDLNTGKFEFIENEEQWNKWKNRQKENIINNNLTDLQKERLKIIDEKLDLDETEKQKFRDQVINREMTEKGRKLLEEFEKTYSLGRRDIKQLTIGAKSDYAKVNTTPPDVLTNSRKWGY